MTTYRNIHGRSIQAVTTDPTGDVTEGQVWYNTSSETFKTVLLNEAWVSATPMTTFRYGMAGGGTQSAAFVGGGYPTPSPDPTNVTEEYNGSGWSTGGNMNTARMYIGGSGTQTAGLASGGDQYPSPRYSVLVEEYDGSSWTVQNTLPTQNKNMGSCGTQTASLNIGGSVPAATNVTNSYDGTNWTNTGHNLNTARFSLRAVGTTTSALVNGGNPNLQTTEEYDGSSWTSASNSVSNFDAHSSAGTQTAARMFGGFPSPSAQHNIYDGSSWSTAPNLGTGRYYGALGPIGTSTAALMAGGNASPSPVTGVATEEFTSSANVITAAAFSNGGSLNTGRWGLGGCGTQTAGIAFGGRNPPVGQDLARSEQYDGSSWSEGPDLNTATRVCGKGTGTQTAALKHGGHYGSPSTRYKVAEEWDGSSWTNGGTSTNAHDGTMQIGTQTAAASCGGYDGSPMNETEEYNGTSFSTANAMTYSGYSGGASGPQTAAVVFGGGFPAVFTSSEYDGTNWTAGGTLPPSRGGYGTCGNTGNGSQTAAIGAGGYAPGPSYFNGSFIYDGTIFSTGPNISTARNELASGGPNSSFYITGGLTSPGAASNATEEFTEETTAVNVKTLTQS